MFGLTHDAETGDQMVRLPRGIKVSIGLPAGKDAHVFIEKDGKWVVTCGREGGAGEKSSLKVVGTAEDARGARELYKKAWLSAPEKKYPEKLPYFTFRSFGEDLQLHPDFQAIAAHGKLPTQVPIMFTDENPIADASYKWWGGGKLKCYGDGKVGMRLIEIASAAQKQVADVAKASGARFFPIQPCYTTGCPMASERVENTKTYPADCKPGLNLAFQLINDPRLGTKAELVTTGRRSIVHLMSSIIELQNIVYGITGRYDLRGIPLYLVVRPYFTNHKGQKSKAWSVSVELRPDSLRGMRKQIVGWASEFQAALLGEGTAPRQIEAPPVVESVEPEPVTEAEAESIEAEFYPEDEVTEDAPIRAEAETAKTTDRLAAPAPTAEQVSEKISKNKRSAAPAVLPAPVDEQGFF